LSLLHSNETPLLGGRRSGVIERGGKS
jgi:hypothetical protein